MSQVEIHYTCILATHQLFPCNDFHPSIHFALVDSISCYIISFPNKSKQKGLWYLPRLQQSPLVYLISSTAVIHLSISSTHPSIHLLLCFLTPFSKSRFWLFDCSLHGPAVALFALPPSLLFKQNYCFLLPRIQSRKCIVVMRLIVVYYS